MCEGKNNMEEKNQWQYRINNKVMVADPQDHRLEENQEFASLKSVYEIVKIVFSVNTRKFFT